MSCGCDNLKKRMNLSSVRRLARIASKMEGVNYVIFEWNNLYDFCAEGAPYKGKFVELVEKE